MSLIFVVIFLFQLGSSLCSLLAAENPPLPISYTFRLDAGASLKSNSTDNALIAGPYMQIKSQIPNSSCPISSIRYTKIMSLEGRMRIPHSRMFMNGVRCGSLDDNATQEQLRNDQYMDLMRIDSLRDEATARKNGVYSAFYRMEFSVFISRFFKLALMQYDTSNLTTYVGFERFYNRVCRNKNESFDLPQNSFVFVGSQGMRHANLTPIVDRLPAGQDIFLAPNVFFQVTFAPGNGTESEHVCPYEVAYAVQNKSTNTQERMCFPGRAKVKTVKNKALPMRMLQIGDVVWSTDEETTEVFMFSHRDANSRTRMIRVECERNISVTLSAGHYVLTDVGLQTASGIRKGDTIVTETGERKISGVKESWEYGLYNPHTLSGSFVVDGVIVSCYTTAVWPFTAHSLLAPVRAVYVILKSVRWAKRVFISDMQYGSPVRDIGIVDTKMKWGVFGILECFSYSMPIVSGWT